MAVSGTMMAVGLASNYMAGEEQKEAARKQRQAQERANAVEQRRADIANQRSRRQAIAQTQMAQSANIAAMAASGGVSSTGLGANTSLGSQLSSAVGFGNTSLAANNASALAIQQGVNAAASHTARANNFAAFGNLNYQAAPMFMKK